MKSRASLMAMLAIAAGTLLGAASGCELIAGVDRSKIEGAGAGGTGGSTAGGGTGGTGGTTTPTGGGGTGGTTTCDPAKCPVPADECKVAICDAMDMCAEGPAADGKVSATQIVGDCKQNVCMGGAIVSQNLDTDIEDDNQTCTADTCDAGAAQHKPNPQGTSCTENNGAVCDAGGTCVECNVDADCAGAAPKTICDPNGGHVCVLPHCTNTTKDSTETDVDCGGPDCADCADDLGCGDANDCQSNNCQGMKCAAATCNDSIINNMVLGESDVDCGGSCPGCAFDKVCGVNTDCKSGDCTSGKCAANCMDTQKDQDESDIDCGGVCSDCINGKDCNSKTDCQSNFCNPGGKCAACANDNECAGSEYCSNGSCVNDKATGLVCTAGTQCVTNNCVDGFCCGSATCGSCESCGIAGAEGACASIHNSPDPDNCNTTQTCDNAGACKKIDGQVCAVAADCLNGNCVDGVCCNSPCTTACKACNIAGSVGTCSNVASGQDDNFPANVCNGVNSCDGTGNGATACKKDVGQACPGGNADCVNGQCVDGFCCGSASCATCKSCGIAGSEGSCANIAINITDNNPANACTGTNACDGAGTCKKVIGQACAAGECLSGNCIDGVCCNSVCGGQCQSCNLAGSVGTCAPIPAGADPANECSGAAPADLCNGASGCGLGPSGAVCVASATGVCTGPADCPAVMPFVCP